MRSLYLYFIFCLSLFASAIFTVSYSYSLGYQNFMLSLKAEITLLDNFVIREESISPYSPTYHHHHPSSQSQIPEELKIETTVKKLFLKLHFVSLIFL